MRKKKPWVAAIVSAALLFNGGLALTPKAYADDDGPVFTKVKAPLDTKLFISDWMKGIATKTYALTVDKEYIDFQDALSAGQSLADASGIGTSELNEKLRMLAQNDINQALQSYTLTGEQLEKLRSELYADIQTAVSTPGYAKTSMKGSFDFNTLLQNRLAEVKSVAVGLSQEETADIETRLEAGESLAGAARVNESDLVNVLVTPLLQSIGDAVATGLISKEEGDKLSDRAASSIKSAVTSPDKTQATTSSDSASSAWLKNHLQSLVSDAYTVATKDDLIYPEMKEAYEAGASLAQLTGLSDSELVSRIVKLWENDLADLPENTRSDALQQAAKAVAEAVRSGK
ncbi:hypothetical protein [Paenibacillus hamazuiensis]|uniref:hypothetical protein n=1 Tax=Paenibacillus hamazuiensis TaxID=2936508 RepID=UPI00200CE25F|nr:hypothetical protein [Paenibacillus hamazuiensis]